MKEGEGRQLTTWAAWGLEEEEELRPPPPTDRPTDPRQRPFSLTHSLTKGEDSRNHGLRRRGRWRGFFSALLFLFAGLLLFFLFFFLVERARIAYRCRPRCSLIRASCCY